MQKKWVIIVVVLAIILSLSIGLNMGLLFSRNDANNSPTATPTINPQPTATPTGIPEVTPSPTANPVTNNHGFRVGDFFKYSIAGTSTLTDSNAIETPGFSQYNETDFYKITITSVTNNSEVSFNTLWRFVNGTEIAGSQTIDLLNGQKTDSNGFWAVYAPNIEVGDFLHPSGYDGLKVNSTDSKTYANSVRERDFWSIENQFYNVNDPTHNTMRDDYTGVYFDKQTGMLETLNSITYYNNPLKTETITWKLVATDIWLVNP